MYKVYLLTMTVKKNILLFKDFESLFVWFFSFSYHIFAFLLASRFFSKWPIDKFLYKETFKQVQSQPNRIGKSTNKNNVIFHWQGYHNSIIWKTYLYFVFRTSYLILGLKTLSIGYVTYRLLRWLLTSMHVIKPQDWGIRGNGR